MESIRELMAEKHRRCDDYFVTAERAVASANWDKASAEFEKFRDAMSRHFDVEENILFPAFEAHTGVFMGPTQVMRGEHKQLRELMSVAEAALAARDADDYSGTAETLLIMLQQHNMKEENVLYPMCDQHLAEHLDVLLPQLKNELIS
ncbi:hemerythrin domain-containing protein [Propionivibrio sp.]|uniref:hemerythrin domain-containing protein n=1 Tax=Propionivibrio sp. TaxID=2212460 RepID=UPI0025D12D5A|nr:hemerythrin domain-containing protein [Propionivibrio sp.]MBK7356436.1 hemerythrin domain-containing protein [Propionivibrio sp.]MBK8400097.1 hemerythrin domain-containing protein [Propionivibrio sp.]MBK8744661.1 hemerythrin domain-containing protein [Propionivibrio sp.]MBL0207915.1 hemerythrin domain-containing protein [Propionivibrio sp.]